HYRLMEVLGKGGMGVVYRARRDGTELDVAIKVLPDQFFADDDARRRFRREMLLSVRFSHPHLVRVLEIGFVSGQGFLVMEFMSGGTLDKMVKLNRSLPWYQVLGVARSVGQALAYLHGKDVVHRDVKLSNLLLDNGVVKIGDYGL